MHSVESSKQFVSWFQLFTEMTVRPRISTPARIRAARNSKQVQAQNLEDSEAAEALTNLVFVSVPLKSAMKPKTKILEAPVARRSSRLQRRDLHQSLSQPSTPDSDRGNPPANQVNSNSSILPFILMH